MKPSRALLPLLTLASSPYWAGCGLERQAPLPAAPENRPLTGVVVRGGAAISGWKVKLYTDEAEATLLDSTFTGVDGSFGLREEPAGSYMVKVSSDQPGDFGYVRYFFDVADVGARVETPPLDLLDNGASLLAPGDEAVLPRPGFSSAVEFQWGAYRGPYVWANARVHDAAGVEVWASAKGTATSASWNGAANAGPRAGERLPAGTYTWRVKLRLSNGVIAATRLRSLVLREG